MNDNTPQFDIQRIYTKDISLEAPNTPEVFQGGEWKPEVSVDLNIGRKDLDPKTKEVVLTVTVKAQVQGKVAFLAEVKQAGIFTVAGFETAQADQILGALCPGIIFPYAREVISDIITRASFPQLLLAPINFDALYQQQQAGKEGQTVQ